jgi:hypothetical protein
MARTAWAQVTSVQEASGCLLASPVFKTDERRIASLAGSIPVRLRMDSAAGNGILAAVRISAEQSVDVRPNVSHPDY